MVGKVGIMNVAVHYQAQRVDIEVSEGSLVGFWEGRAGTEGEACRGLITEALESAIDYPALRRTVVPGDRVAIAVGRDVPEAARLVAEVVSVLGESGVGSDLVTILGAPEISEVTARELSQVAAFRRHDPGDRETIAYLANSAGERRIYLGRELVDADFVVTIGTIGFDPYLGYRGPWSALFPEASDKETRSAFQAKLLEETPEPNAPGPLLKESLEVSWLLGSQFQVGVVPGTRGIAAVLGGLGANFERRCFAEAERVWGFYAESRAEMVIAGVGGPGDATGIEDVARGLTAACRVVQHGGKVVLLSAAEGKLGRSTRRLIEAEASGRRASPLRGLESEPDFAIASMIAASTAWADVYILSRLSPDDLEGLGMIPLEKSREAARLASLSRSCLVFSHAERVGTKVIEE